jgi:hypothetical protein
MSRLDKYEPGYIQAWHDATKKDVVFKLPSKARAIELRHYLYRLRKDMGLDEHPFYSEATKVKIHMKQIPDPLGPLWTLILKARGDDEVLKAAGYSSDEIPAKPGVPEAPKIDWE